MDFSESFRTSGPKPAFSPNGRYVATVVEYRLIIRDVEHLRVIQLYSCLDRIDCIEWSSNSNYVLCGLFSRGIVQVWSVDSPEWTCRIDEGPAGVAAVRWSPDGACILATADFGIRITVWSLLDRKCTYLRGPKHVGAGLAFSADGSHLAVLERTEGKDWAAVYDTRTWGEAAHFTLPTADAADLAWSPEGGLLAIWDSCLSYKLALVDARSGAAVASYSAYANEALGIKCVSWAPRGELLAVGSYDRCARLLNHLSWTPLLEAEHGRSLAGPAGLVVYREESDEPVGPGQAQAQAHGRSRYAIAPLPAALPFSKPPLDSPAPKLGVGRCAWSGDGRYLATLEDSAGACVWVWDTAAMELAAVLVQLAPVTDLAWAPRGATLALVAGSTKVHLWTPAGASIVHVPLPDFKAHGCSWNPTGTALLLLGREAFCCAYLTA
ncbi:hypothetical protein HYH03_003750 [Edaphochlamys debaryana]|uniref:WD repeat-containing protein WRAP73 n=1 Tax=Edaphochlamys debaryana TaxID=47281 RepID=A0A835YIX4_9CHLO|nr:hypothetical protein HYH03_003750 [Edaphochlamys debaryana]|eukprot:KAG2498499.1 hypothetical protein HYH03_003750 [Edaphochlamys debaryana]